MERTHITPEKAEELRLRTKAAREAIEAASNSTPLQKQAAVKLETEIN